MCDQWKQQGVATKDFRISFPRQPLSASAASEPLPPNAPGRPIELPDAPVVRRSSGVLVVAPELGVEELLLLVHRLVSVLLAPFGP